MALYFLLGTMTAQGRKMIYDDPTLLGETTGNISVPGTTILGRYAVLGHYDFLMMIDGDDNEAVARLSLEVGVRTGMHIETLPGIAMGFMSSPPEGEDLERPEAVQRTIPQS